MNQPQIDIYYFRGCGACTKALDYFHSRGLDFRAHHVEWDETAQRFTDSANTREMFRRCGEEFDFVPQMFVGNTHIPGWMKLGPMTQNGEFDALLKQEASDAKP